MCFLTQSGRLTLLATMYKRKGRMPPNHQLNFQMKLTAISLLINFVVLAEAAPLVRRTCFLFPSLCPGIGSIVSSGSNASTNQNSNTNTNKNSNTNININNNSNSNSNSNSYSGGNTSGNSGCSGSSCGSVSAVGGSTGY